MHRDLFTSLFFSRIRYKTFLLISFYFLLISKSALATDEINMDGPLALHGYDPVSYFSATPTLGENKIYSVYRQAKYLFSSVSNKQKFDSDPLAYEIRDDHLYVLLNRATHKMWQQEMTENIQISDRLWPQIKSTSASSLR